jgi:hypothetical protein
VEFELFVFAAVLAIQHVKEYLLSFLEGKPSSNRFDRQCPSLKRPEKMVLRPKLRGQWNFNFDVRFRPPHDIRHIGVKHGECALSASTPPAVSLSSSSGTGGATEKLVVDVCPSAGRQTSPCFLTNTL